MRGAAALLLLLSLGSAACGHRVAPPAAVSVSTTTKRPAAVPHAASAVRRVCRQAGLGVAGAGGGSIVFVTGAEGGGIGIDTLLGDHFALPPPPPSAPALCPVAEQPMRICAARPGEAPSVPLDFAFDSQGAATAAGSIARGAPVTLLEYVSGGGATRALVAIDGQARFLSADDLCHAEAIPAVSPATTQFAMDRSAPGGPKAFRPRSPAAIRRIVIHNTEVPLLQTLLHFGRTDANTSAHVVIDRDGSYYRVIEDQFTAFHAGASKDGLGGHNATSLGIEVVAYTDAKYGGDSGKFGFFSDAQREAVIRLVDFWMATYHLEIEPEVMANRATTPGYADLEYRGAALTIHRLTKADRGTDCPRLLFPQSPAGDEAFFRWREATFSAAARRERLERAISPSSSASASGPPTLPSSTPSSPSGSSSSRSPPRSGTGG